MRFVVACAALAAMSSAALAQTLAQTPDITAPSRVELAPGQTQADLLPAVIEHSRTLATLANGQLGGEGGAFLRALGRRSQFVLIGEEHGNARIAEFIGAYWRDLSDAGYRYAALEVDPTTTGALERELRAGGVTAWTRFVDARGGAVAAPFFTWAPEAVLAETMVTTSAAQRVPVLWGLDQTFIGAASWQLREIADGARDPEARAMAAALAAQAADANALNWFGQADSAPFVALRAELSSRSDRRFARTVDEMIASQRIYRPFTGGAGEPWLANLERENQMRSLFLEHYRAAERADGAPPRVMLKFGGNHMFRGASPTHVQALGGFVTELANTTGQGGAVSIYTACGPGSSLGTYGAEAFSCDGSFQENWGFLARYVDPNALTVFDFRVWKMRARRWEHLPADIRALIDSYDVMVVVPNGAASQWLPGIDPPPAG